MWRRRLVPGLVLLSCVALGRQIGGANRLGPGSFEVREAARLRAHFAQVERELLSRDIRGLSISQRAEQARLITLLHGYAARGEFPRNDSHPGRQVPYFRDRRGNLCAMAFLLAATGRGDLVDHIARTRNNAYVEALADEPGLAQWLDQHGLSLAEAARIQPSYGGGGCCTVGDPPATRPSAGYVAASVGATGLSALSIALNARTAAHLSTRPWNGILGLGVGGISLALGLARVGDHGWQNQAIGAWNVAIGVTAAFLGGRALALRGQGAARAVSRLRIAPVAMAGTGPALGFEGRFRF